MERARITSIRPPRPEPVQILHATRIHALRAVFFPDGSGRGFCFRGDDTVLGGSRGAQRAMGVVIFATAPGIARCADELGLQLGRFLPGRFCNCSNNLHTLNSVSVPFRRRTIFPCWTADEAVFHGVASSPSFQVNDAAPRPERMGPPAQDFQGLRRAGRARSSSRAAVMAAAWFSVSSLEKAQHREIAYIIWILVFHEKAPVQGEKSAFIEMADHPSCQATTPRVTTGISLATVRWLPSSLRMIRRMHEFH